MRPSRSLAFPGIDILSPEELREMNVPELGRLLAEVREYRAGLDDLPAGDLVDQMIGRVDDYVAQIGSALYDLGSEIPEPSPVGYVAEDPEPPPVAPGRQRRGKTWRARSGTRWRRRG